MEGQARFRHRRSLPSGRGGLGWGGSAPTTPIRILRARRWATGLIGLLAAAACGGGGSGGGGAAVSLRLDTTASGYDAPMVLAQDKGWYRDAGLDVTIGEGNGSGTTVQLVGRGSDTFGWADFGTMMKLSASGAPVKALAVVGQTSPLAIITLQGSPVEQPRDLEGRILGLNPNGASQQIFRALAVKENLDTSRIKIVTAADNTLASLLLQHRLDAFIGWVTYESPQVKQLGGAPKNILFSSYGVNVLNTSLVASDAYLAHNRATACKFVDQSLRAYAYAMNHPDEAVDALVKKYPRVNRALALDQLQAQFQLLHTGNSQGRPLGWIAPQDVAATEDVLVKYAGMSAGHPASAFYSDACFNG
jgi:NitT/TauT family transport system substrate-binding protein